MPDDAPDQDVLDESAVETTDVEVDATETDTTLETSQDDTAPALVPGTDTAAEPVPAKRNRTQERIDELTSDKYRLKGALEVTQQELVAERAKNATKPADETPETPELVAPVKPTLEQFDGDYEQFTAALTTYTDDSIKFQLDADQKQGVENAARVNREQEVRLQRKKEQEQWGGQVKEAVEKYPDFEVVALTPSLPVTEVMGRAIQTLENGADVLYHLGKNPEQAARIAGMSPEQQPVQLGRIAGQLATKPVEVQKSGKKVSTAPAPAVPTKGSSAVEKDPSKMSQAEYNEWRDSGGGT